MDKQDFFFFHFHLILGQEGGGGVGSDCEQFIKNNLNSCHNFSCTDIFNFKFIFTLKRNIHM